MPIENIKILNASCSELNVLNNLMYHSKAYYGYDETLLSNFMRYYKLSESYLKRATVRVLHLNEQPIGLSCLKINDEGIGELESFYIHPDYIGKGFGSMLWQDTCAIAKNLHLTYFIFGVEPKPLAENFYMRKGALKIKKVFSDATYRYAWLMVYSLKALK